MADWEAFFRGSKYEAKWRKANNLEPLPPPESRIDEIGVWWEKLLKEREKEPPHAEPINPFGEP